MAVLPFESITNKEVRNKIFRAKHDASNLLKNAGIGLKELTIQGLIETNIDMSHITARNWTIEDAIRDILQNVMDEDEDHGKQFSINDITWENRVLKIIDHGSGLTSKAFGLGGTKESVCYRGGFGEGLKISLGTLIENNVDPIVMATKDAVFVATSFPMIDSLGTVGLTINTDWLGIIILKPKYASKFKYGTLTLLPDPLHEYTDIIKELLPPKAIFTTKMPALFPPLSRKVPNAANCYKQYSILEHTLDTSIYIGGLFMHSTMDDQVFNSTQTYYGYDIWANPKTQEIEASRRNYTSPLSISLKIMYLWYDFYKKEPEKAVNAFYKLLKEASSQSYGSKITVIDNIVGELNLAYIDSLEDYLPDNVIHGIKEMTTRAVKLLTRSSQMVLFRVGPNEVSNLGPIMWSLAKTNIVIWNAKWPRPDLPDYTEKLKEQLKKDIKLLKKGKHDDTLAHSILSTMFATIYDKEHRIVLYDRVDSDDPLGMATIEEDLPIIGIAIKNHNGNYRSPNEILETMIHELAHLQPIAYDMNMTLPDLSESFVHALTKVSAYFITNMPIIKILSLYLMPTKMDSNTINFIFKSTSQKSIKYPFKITDEMRKQLKDEPVLLEALTTNAPKEAYHDGTSTNPVVELDILKYSILKSYKELQDPQYTLLPRDFYKGHMDTKFLISVKKKQLPALKEFLLLNQIRYHSDGIRYVGLPDTFVLSIDTGNTHKYYINGTKVINSYELDSYLDYLRVEKLKGVADEWM